MYNRKFDLKILTQLSVTFFILTVIVLPSGDIGGINVKILSMLILLFMLLINLANRGNISRRSIFLILSSMSAMLFVFFNYVRATYLSDINNYAKVEGMLFVTYFLSTAVLAVLLVEKFVDKDKIIGAIFYSAIFYSIIKILLTLLSFLNIIPIELTATFIQDKFFVQPMLFPITDNISRLQLANDYIICFVLFFLITQSNSFNFLKSNKIKVFFFLLLFLSVILSFSRYMLLVLAVAIVIRILQIKNFSLKGIVSFFTFISIILIFYLNYFDAVNDFIALRFSSDTSGSSDSVRETQVSCLLSAFQENPILGHGGLGDFSPLCPGPLEAKFSYEVQYLGYLFRFGILQTIFIVLIYFLQFRISIEKKILAKNKVIPFIGVLMWMAIGFFNPYLISSYASIIMVLCICLSLNFENNKLNY